MLRLPLVIVAVLFALPSAALAEEKNAAAADTCRVYLGTYTGAKSKGIYLAELDVKTGALSPAVVAAEVASPSFLAIHPTQKFLYAVNEITEGGKKRGGVTAFAVDAASGKLKMLNQQPSGGDGPCHIVVDKAGKNALIANYGGGSCGVLPILEDGKLGPMSSLRQHEGSGAIPARQQGPHAHSINLDAANRFAFVADLGLDKVLVYRFDAGKGTITPSDPPFAAVAPGAGPRHFAFHPSGKQAYVINEMNLTVTAFNYDAAGGVLKEFQTLSTLPKDAKGEDFSTAEVVVHPSGRFLYGSNRGHNTIAVFAIDQSTGKLTPVQHQGEGIKTPRNFNIDPTGMWLLVANQSGDSVVVLKIDQATGALKPTGQAIEVPSPVCVRFLMPKA
ncbi:MAG: lactonase family protein [Planctomycetia bacterium]|nr:lactonase family protein [Planctomycetia bacterium]